MKLDDEACRRLQVNVADLLVLVLAERGYRVERHSDGRKRLPSLEVVGVAADGDHARVVVHIDRVIA